MHHSEMGIYQNTNKGRFLGINYKELLPQVLEAMYPDPEIRKTIIKKISKYGEKDFQNEIDRVHLGILKLAHKNQKMIDEYIELACLDYRDLIMNAEYANLEDHEILDPIIKYSRWIDEVLKTF